MKYVTHPMVCPACENKTAPPGMECYLCGPSVVRSFATAAADIVASFTVNQPRCGHAPAGPKWTCKYCDGVGRHKVGCRCKSKPHLRLHYVAGHWAVDQPGAMRWTCICPTAAVAVELARRWF